MEMQCSLCGGPLRVEHPQRFVCRHGHELTPPELEDAAEARVGLALWMAIEALESQAEAPRITADGSGGAREVARRVARNARILRRVARSRLAPASEAGQGDQTA